ncbi:polyketide synthase [Actinoalloteichus sp. AHMU CJ021]|uniref:type I polyketide synthase n=1 Tax=Actinoalloteichus sp. AHMU CJ021 TaxID=2072503 RepID=UPI000CA07245|nr:polyketide synthase [Actinoalloteichus sp. AHMU CJ021]
MLRTELIRPVHELVRDHARDIPERTAYSDARRSVSYAELSARTGRLAGHLAALGVAPGERVAFVLGNGVSLVESYLATARASAVGVPVNPLSSDDELAHLLADSGAVAVITDPARIARLTRVAPALTTVLADEVDPVDWDGPRFEDLATSPAPEPARDDLGVDDWAFMLYTSGTTGRPKGVRSSTRNSLWTIAACYAPILGLSGEDRVLWPLPLHHCLGHHLGTLGVLAVGASAHVTSGFAAEEVLAGLAAGEFSVLVGVPAMYQELLRAADADGIVAPGLRLCLTAGAVGGAELPARVEARFGAPLIDSYGTTETCGPITTNWPGGTRVPGSCGLPVPGLSVRLVDPGTRTDVPVGEDGEVWVRGPNVMAGYHRDPGATADALPGGWYRTGDLARRDDHGYLTVTGRISELIIRGGENIHPAEVEQVLLGAPGVLDAAVGPAPDPRLGEVPVAYLVARDDLDPEEVLRVCREKLAGFRVPTQLRALDALPRTAAGKVTRHLLAERPWRLLAEVPTTAEEPAPGADEGRADGLRASLLPLSRRERHRRLLGLVREGTAAALGVDRADVTDDRPFGELGLTSLTALLVRDAVVRRAGVPLPATVVFDHPTPDSVARLLRDRLFGTTTTVTAGGTSSRPEPRRRAAPAEPDDDPVVIVGMGCRLPGGVDDPADLWRLVVDGVDATGEFPTTRGWPLHRLHDPDPDRPGRSITTRGGFRADVEDFDAEHFGISPREALAMDPQQRLLLEVAWRTLENAGIAPDSLRDREVGVFTGVMRHEYGAGIDPLPPELEGYLDVGKLGSVASGRIAYTLGLRGPALTVDTACSSSLVALHLAARSLRAGECELALAGAATVISTPQLFVEFSRQRGLSPDGRCRSFSADADGTGWAEGAGLLLLQRLSAARRDGREVLAVLRGSAVNSDGASHGLTVPNGQAQRAVIRRALADAGLEPSEVDAVEAHGTGTVLGDPIEANALADTYGADRDHPLWLGSLKSNLGHTQAAAGVAGVIKVVLALRAGRLPRTLHVDRPSPHVDWATSGLALLTEEQPWPDHGRPRRAGVSSFGISGTNAHVVLEQAPAPPEAAPTTRTPPPLVPLVLSGRDDQALRAQVDRLTDHLRGSGGADASDLGFSLAAGRATLDHRGVLLLGADEDPARALRDWSDRAVTTTVGGGGDGVVLVFPGQGSQWAGMGTRLLAVSAPFRAELAACDDALRPHLGYSALDVLTGAEGAPGLDTVDVVQPVLWAVMVALGRLWTSLGVRPDAVIGHSQGELAALCVAGGLDLGDAARIIALRARALREIAGDGGMVSVPLSAADTERRLPPGTVVAASNGPRSTVVSGDGAALDRLVASCADDGIRARRIPVDYASHSPRMEALRDRLVDLAADIRPRACDTRFYSTVTGTRVDTADLGPEYWFRNLRDPVRFQDAVEAALADGHRVFVESSPHPVLTVGLTDILDEREATGVVTGSLRRDHDDLTPLLTAAAQLWTAGVDVDWTSWFQGSGARRVPLPGYAFRRQRFWLPPAGGGTGDLGSAGITAADHPLLGASVDLPDATVHTALISLTTHPWLADHAVRGTALVPGTAVLDLVATVAAGHGCDRIEELTLTAPVAVELDVPVTLRLVVDQPDADGRRPVALHARAGDRPWTTHATGAVVAAGPGPAPAAWSTGAAEPVDLDGAYDRLADRGYEYGPLFRGLRALWRTGTGPGAELHAEVELPEDTGGDFTCHPALLDAVLQAIGASGADVGGAGTPLPFGFTGVELRAPTGRALRARLRVLDATTVEVVAVDHAGRLVARVEALTLRSPAAAAPAPHRLDHVPVDHPAATDVRVAALDADLTAPHPVPDPVPVEDAEFVLVRAPAGDPGTATRAALALAKDWIGRDATLVVLTRGGGPVTGLFRAAATEHPGAFATVDGDPGPAWPAVFGALRAGESDLAVRDGVVTAARLRPASAPPPTDPPPLPVPDGPWRLAIGGTGSLDDLAAVPAPPAPLRPGQVRIAVRAAGVNFRDVLLALGVVAVTDDVLGGEAAGVVVETAADVTHLHPGDRVFGVVDGAFAPRVVADARMLAPIPAGWSFADAAGVPIAQLTAHYGLFDVAGLQPGQTVLVHAGTGGVGMAAIALARRHGARVLATASPGKWSVLRDLGIPEDHIASSRDTGFEERFRAVTGGRGVDVVLNSLTGEFVDAGLRLTAPGGRFVELGKTDIRDPGTAPGLTYRAFDLLTDAGPERIGEMLAALTTDGPGPLPTRAWDVRHARAALRVMAAGRHTGKNVLTVPAPVDPGGTALITGGTGVLGGLVARHLAARHGIRRLVLLSRGGHAAPELLADLAEAGAEVRVVACDAADRAALRALLATVDDLGVVVHAAGVLADATVANTDPDTLPAVLDPKIAAARHLHELTAHTDLAAFVLFSSIAGTLGGAGQAGYAAANAALDALAVERRAAGLPAVSIAWGMWAEVSGMTGHLTDRDRERLRRGGVLPMDTDAALALFDAALDSPDPCVVAAALDPRSARPLPPAMRVLVRGRPVDRPARGGGARLGDLPAADRPAAALALVRAEAAAVLGHPGPAAVVPDRAFSEQGFDSLTGVELRNRLQAATGLRMSTTAAFDHPTPAALATHLLTALDGTPAPARTATRAAPAAEDEPVAIIGMSCRFPGGIASPEDLWRVVDDEVDVVGPFPTDRGWDLAALFDEDPDRTGTSYVRAGAFLDDVAGFDAAFFGISPREATAMDPQQRLLLELAWEVFEDAGIDPTALRGSPVAVYAGQIHHDYVGRLRTVPGELEGYLGHGTAGSVASGRIAYTFGLEGPAVTVDTACSSSLVALHLAVGALRSGECDLALAGGASVMSSPTPFVEFSRQRGLAPDGRCKPFAAAADGTGWSEGAGLLLVERLSDARRHGHPVLAVVRGTSVNQDGASNGLTAPNGPAQQRVIRQALASAGLAARDVHLVEAHGTGTRLGDPIEAEALLATYGRDRDTPLWLGSVKSNLGHSQAAAGVAGLIKVVQAMRHARMPRTLHVDRPTGHVDWTAGAVELLTEARDWTGEAPRRGAVSSFGVSGTNAHVILEQAPDEPGRPDPAPDIGPSTAPPLLLSARSGAALTEQAGRLARLLTDDDVDVTDVAHGLLTRRAALDRRAVVLGADRDGLHAGLRALASSRPTPSVVTGVVDPDARTVLVFPGQGAQWPGMARDLLAESPVFAARIADCAAALRRHADLDLEAALRTGAGLDRVDVLQPALFAMMVSLAAVWEEHGVRPDAVIGHSQGEIAAACVAGALSLDDAARVVAVRARALRDLAGTGGMLSVGLSAADAADHLAPHAGRVSVAATNGPLATVLAGPPEDLDALAAALHSAGVRARRIAVDYASHSPAVDTLRDTLVRDLADIHPGHPTVPMRSTVSGDWVRAGELTADHWFRNLREPVRYLPATEALLAGGHRTFVEVSPHPVLLPATGDIAEAAGVPVGLVATLRRDHGGHRQVLTAVAEAHVRGVPVDWSTVIARRTARPVALPTYPFQHRRYWIDEPDTPQERDDDFWTAVHDGDTETLRTRLGLADVEDLHALDRLLPALATWHTPAGADLCHRVEWRPLPHRPATTPPEGRWLVLTPSSVEVPAGIPAGFEVRTATDTSRAGLARLLADGETAGVVSLLSLADEGTATGGLFATVHLVQALPKGVPLWIVTRGAVSAAPGDDVPNPGQAAQWGLGRVLAAERPDSWGGLVDVVDLDALTWLPTAVAGDEDELALRAGRAWTRRIRPAPAPPTPGRWRPAGTAVVTGGEGTTGRLVATWLAALGAPRVLLLTDPATPPPEDLPSAVHPVPCDPADEDALRAALADETPRVVVHTAGVLDDAMLTDLTDAQLTRVLRARVTAATALDRVSRDHEVDAFVLFSSVGGTLGASGQGGYAPGHAVLDALAARRRAQGLPATSVAWGHWASDGDHGRRPGVRDLDPERALATLRRILDAPADTLVADLDWAVVAGPTPPPLLRDLLPAAEDTAGPADLLARLRAADPAARHRIVRALVLDTTAAVLQHGELDSVDPGRGFREQGFDSLASVRLRDGLNTATGLRLPATAAFDHPTPDALTRHVLAELDLDDAPGAGGADIESASDEELIALLDAEFGIS